MQSRFCLATTIALLFSVPLGLCQCIAGGGGRFLYPQYLPASASNAPYIYPYTNTSPYSSRSAQPPWMWPTTFNPSAYYKYPEAGAAGGYGGAVNPSRGASDLSKNVASTPELDHAISELISSLGKSHIIPQNSTPISFSASPNYPSPNTSWKSPNTDPRPAPALNPPTARQTSNTLASAQAKNPAGMTPLNPSMQVENDGQKKIDDGQKKMDEELMCFPALSPIVSTWLTGIAPVNGKEYMQNRDKLCYRRADLRAARVIL